MFSLMLISNVNESARAVGNDYIDGNRKLVERLQAVPFRYRVLKYSSLSVLGSIHASDGLDSVTDVWRSGVRRREFRRVFRYFSPNGFKQVEHNRGRVTFESCDGEHTRFLEGWDFERPDPLPLEFGRDAEAFGRVSGQIFPASIERRDLAADSSIMLWTVFGGLSLAEVAADSELLEIPSGRTGIVRLQLTSTRNPELTTFVGSLVEIDTTRACSVQRIELTDTDSTTIKEVKEFAECMPGLWIPVVCESRRTLSTGQATQVSRWMVKDFTFGIPLAESELIVEFPAGCRVDEQPTGMIHLWGEDGKPSATFSNHKQMLEAVYARAREYQSRNLSQSPARFFPESNWWAFVIVNGGLVAALVGLTFLRRRLARPAASSAVSNAESAPPSPSPEAPSAAKGAS